MAAQPNLAEVSVAKSGASWFDLERGSIWQGYRT
jgi:hypothetical protein